MDIHKSSMYIHNSSKDIQKSFMDIQKSFMDIQKSFIRFYTRVPGNPDRDACIRLALNHGLDQDNPVCI